MRFENNRQKTFASSTVSSQDNPSIQNIAHQKFERVVSKRLPHRRPYRLRGGTSWSWNKWSRPCPLQWPLQRHQSERLRMRRRRCWKCCRCHCCCCWFRPWLLLLLLLLLCQGRGEARHHLVNNQIMVEILKFVGYAKGAFSVGPPPKFTP